MVKIKVEKRDLFWVGLIILVGAIVGVYAFVNPTTGVGHSYTELQGCASANQILKWTGSSWSCVESELQSCADGQILKTSGTSWGCYTLESIPSSFKITDVSDLWINNNDELCYKYYNSGCEGTTTLTCSKTSPGIKYINGPCDVAEEICSNYCSNLIACDGDISSSCLGGTKVYYPINPQDYNCNNNIIACICQGVSGTYQYELFSEERVQTRCI